MTILEALAFQPIIIYVMPIFFLRMKNLTKPILHSSASHIAVLMQGISRFCIVNSIMIMSSFPVNVSRDNRNIRFFEILKCSLDEAFFESVN
jgi:hypothetical protein